jgi:hypothetical protein
VSCGNRLHVRSTAARLAAASDVARRFGTANSHADSLQPSVAQSSRGVRVSRATRRWDDVRQAEDSRNTADGNLGSDFRSGQNTAHDHAMTTLDTALNLP